MKNFILILIAIFPVVCSSQTYTHSTINLQNTYLGNCMVTTCSGSYYDNGGSGGNYSTSFDSYRTFCPDAVGQCVRFTVNSTALEGIYNMMGALVGCYDYIYFLNSATQTNFNGPYCGSITGAITSTDRSGCLGLFMHSDGSNTQAGFDISISCVPCTNPANGPTGTDDNDCVQNTGVCADTPIASTSAGPGLESTCSDCLISENYSSWYHVIIQTAGTFELSISPTNGTDDYDFALFQASSCASLGTPVRCTYAAGNTTTGMATGQTGTSEDVTGDGWLAPIASVSVGDEFFLMVNDWSGTGAGYTLDWTGSASLNCSVLPVELLNFQGRAYERYIELNWNVATELSLNRYEIEKMINGEWLKILEKEPAGNNSFYAVTDVNPLRGSNLYRLKSIDVNGEFKYHDPINVNFDREFFDVIISANKITINSTDVPITSIRLFNTLGQEINNLSLITLDVGEKYILDLDPLPKATYIIRVNGIEGKLFVKYN